MTYRCWRCKLEFGGQPLRRRRRGRSGYGFVVNLCPHCARKHDVRRLLRTVLGAAALLVAALITFLALALLISWLPDDAW
jgi:hypothetical protein